VPLLVNPDLTPVTPPPTPEEEGSVNQVFTLTLNKNGDSLILPFTAEGPTATEHWCLAPGIEGFDLPKASLLTERAASQFGAFARGVDVDSREIFLPIIVHASTLTELLERRDEFNRVSAPYHLQPTELVATRPDGSQRRIEGYRISDGPVWDLRTWIPRIAFQKFGVVFVCPDPWWRGASAFYTWALPGDVYETFFPITPVNLASSQIIGDPLEVIVAGDVITYPRWEITGGMTALTVEHIESGRSWTLTNTIDSGDTVIVDTDPRLIEVPPVLGPDGETSWFQFLEPPYDLFTLEPGTHHIDVSVTAADANTQIRLELPTLYETA
jgi:Phage tail protein